MMKHKHSRGGGLRVLMALSASLHAREVMSWVPPLRGFTSNLLNAAWNPVPGSTNIVNSDGTIFYTNAMPAKVDFYRVGVGLR